MDSFFFIFFLIYFEFGVISGQIWYDLYFMYIEQKATQHDFFCYIYTQLKKKMSINTFK